MNNVTMQEPSKNTIIDGCANSFTEDNIDQLFAATEETLANCNKCSFFSYSDGLAVCTKCTK